MEAAVVSSVLNTLAPKIFAFLQENHELRRNLAPDIQYILDELGMIAAAIKDHHRRSWRWSDGTNDAEERWIQRVRDLAYSIQDCLDSFLPRVKGGGLKTMSVQTKFAKKIQKLRKESEDVSRLREKYTVGGQASTSGASPPTSEVPEPHTPAADLVGIDVPRDELLELMREDEGKPKQLKVISIVGFGGLGKTALAWQVYDTVGEEYEPRVWVRASEKGPVDVLSEILREVQVGMRVHDGYCDNLSKCLSECLRSKRFLIVIDDMKTEYWNIIKNAFPKNVAVSSRVIVTTAIRSIAKACSADNGHMYVMRTLDEEHSKRLFFKEASSEYYAPAQQVLKKCDGLPLALVTTAQLLQNKYQLTPKGCAELCRNLGEDVEKEETLARMKHALLQSYYSLPGQQEMLFLLYLGIFPSGRPVRRKRLVRRWLAEGFVEADHRRSAPVVAIDNFKKLMDRSIIQHVDMSNNTEAKTCQTHGMVLEFILHKSMCDNFITLLYDHQARLPDKIRRLSLHHNCAADRLKTIDLSIVRSLTIFGKADEHVLEFSKYKLLRVLDLEECETLNDKHVKNICNLLRLRYLSLGGNITMLPKEISKLKFLETLDVRSAREKILPIPIEVIKLPCLIHLLGKFSSPDVGKEMQKLQDFLSEKSNLETLAGFVADQSPAFPQLMSHMNSLKKVKVWCEPTADGSNSFTDLSRHLQEFIQRSTKVEDGNSLSLSFKGCSQDFLDLRHEDNWCYLSLSSLKLHGELQRLPLFVTKLGSVRELCLSSPDQLSGDVLAALSNVSGLHYLKLITRQLDRFVIKQGELINLRRLCIVVQSMACLENQEGALPQLESLWLLCKGLNGLCGAEIEHLTRLKEVALDDGVSEKTKKEWKEAAKKHLKQPRVSLLERKDVDQNRMQMGVGSEPREVSESRAAPSPEVADIQRQVHRGSEDPAVHNQPAGMFRGLFRSREANGRTSTVVSQEVDRDRYESRHLGSAGRGNFSQRRGWQDESCTEMHGRDGGPHREDNSRGNFRGGFGGRGGNPNPKLDRFRDNVNWESAGGSSKGDEQKKNWGEIGPSTGVLRSEDRGTCFRCLQTGQHQAHCSNPPVCYKCKKIGHMTICAGEPSEKAAFSSTLAIVSAEERLARLKTVGLKVIQPGEDQNPTLVPTDSCPKALEEDDSPEVGEVEGPQSRAAEIADPRVVVHDLTVLTETTDLEVDETTPSDPMVRDAILDQLVDENIAFDLLLEDVRGLTNPTSPEPVKLVEKNRKASGTEFIPPCFKVKTKKSTRSSSVPVVSDQNVPRDQAPKEVPIQSTSQEKVPEDKVVEKAPEQDPLVILTPSAEVDAPEGPQQVPTPIGNPSQPSKFPFPPRFIEDKELDEAWGRISDYQIKMDHDIIFAGYNDLAIRHMVENFAVVGGLAQRIKDLEIKHSELENLEKIKEEVVADKARITQLEEECQAKDRSIADATTKHETLQEKIEEQTQALHRAKKALEFEQDKEAALVQSLDEKIHALNKMIFDMGSGLSMPILRDPTEKMNYLGQLLEDLSGLLKTTRENYAQTMKEGVANGVSFALAKLKASDPSINLQAVEEDFNCLPDEATRFLKELRPLGDMVVEEMEVGSPSSSN